ncbi:hypothetical protein [Arenibacter echinorum]|uniref:Uncharacterized protein n=1 Tax=Arenibacter echinorum TaxID=440515 RepID=A0A327R394_9FLAO|nr:hypothetical protein [Arenibacter echinorum]RAJ10213.1 hypothetical protein LV92_02962 [Arenibacter echinorum]
MKYKINLKKFETIRELPNAWGSENYMELLGIMEFGDTANIPNSELKEMCMLSLTDFEPPEAAEIVLGYLFKEVLSSSQIANLSHEMLHEKMWEEYADLSLHEQFFNAGQLLFQAFNGKFPQPEALRFKVEIEDAKKEDMSVFKSNFEASLIRLLAAGMPKNTLLNRLFSEQLEGQDFPDAKDIIWQYNSETISDKLMGIEVISSVYWFHDLKFTDPFEAELPTAF